MKPNYISVPFKAKADSGLKEYNGCPDKLSDDSEDIDSLTYDDEDY